MQYEIEIKSLLGGSDKARQLEAKMKKSDPEFKEVGRHTQLNHYFEGGDLLKVYQSVKTYLSEDQQHQFQNLIDKAQTYSLRTRQQDSEVLLVVKASVDDTTSANGTARQELEAKLPLSLDHLDKIILDAGFSYQAKWSRDRVEYKYKDAMVMIDKNAGYGYLAEFEKVETDSARSEASKDELRKLMKDLGVEELDQGRLARMFDFYNNHWDEYYGTDKVFTIE